MRDVNEGTMNFGVRMPGHLKRRLDAAAAASNRSLNGEIVHRLESTWAAGNPGVARLLALLEHPRAVRLRARHTRDDVESLLAICRDFDVEALVFSARRDEFNTCCLVVVVETRDVDFVLDGSDINLQRRARLLDVKLLVDELDRLDLLRTARMTRELVPSTVSIAPDEALRAIAHAESTSFNLKNYLRLLSQDPKFDTAEFQQGEPTP